MTHYSNKPMKAQIEIMTHLIIILVTQPLHHFFEKIIFGENSSFFLLIVFFIIQNKINDRMAIVRAGIIELDFGVEVISRQSPSLFLLLKQTNMSLTAVVPL